MKIKLISLALLAGASMNSPQAHQLSRTAPGTVHSGTSGEFTSFEVDPGEDVMDDFYFTLSNSFNLKTSAVINSEDGPSTDTFTVTLFKYNPQFSIDSQTPVNRGSYQFSTTSTPHVFMNVMRGSYFYSMWETKPVTGTDQIAFQSHVVPFTPVTPTHTSAVPEPETLALLLAGLGIVGFVARRRKVG